MLQTLVLSDDPKTPPIKKTKTQNPSITGNHILLEIYKQDASNSCDAPKLTPIEFRKNTQGAQVNVCARSPVCVCK
jgi:hypothetical protein